MCLNTLYSLDSIQIVQVSHVIIIIKTLFCKHIKKFQHKYKILTLKHEKANTSFNY